MITVAKPLAFLAFFLAMAVNPAEAALRKCSNSQMAQATFDPDRVMVMINGEMMGVAAGGTQGVAYIDGDVIRAVPPADIVEIRVGCVQHVTDSGPVTTQVISVVTRRGAERVARRYLRELTEEQQAFRAASGRFARDFDELRFFVQRAPIPVTFEASDERWSATISQGDVTCRAGAGVEVDRFLECADATGKVLGSTRDRSPIASRLRASPF